MSDKWKRHVPSILVVSLFLVALVVSFKVIGGLWSSYRVSTRQQLIVDRLEPETKAPATASDKHAGEDVAAPEKSAPKGPEDQADNDKSEPPKLSPVAQAVARIKEQNLFVTPVKPEFRGIIGVLGDRVLYPGGMSLGVGDTHNGATVKAIGSNWVQFEHEGEIVPVGVNGGSPPAEPEPMAKEAKGDADGEPDNVVRPAQTVETSGEGNEIERVKVKPVVASPPAASQPPASQPTEQ